MKTFAVILFLSISAGHAQTPNREVEHFQAMVAKWDQLASDPTTPTTQMIEQRDMLVAAWLDFKAARSSSMNQVVATTTRDVIEKLLESREVHQAADLLSWHQRFCSENGVGLIGKSRDALEKFVQVHATIIASLGKDPLEDVELPYELIASEVGFGALAEWIRNGERVNEYNGDVVTALPETETLGKYVLMDKTGSIVKSLLVGIEYPPNGKRPSERLASVYNYEEAGPQARGGYRRSSAKEVRDHRIDDRPKDKQIDVPHPQVDKQLDSAIQEHATGQRKLVLGIGLTFVLLLGIGFWFWHSRRAL